MKKEELTYEEAMKKLNLIVQQIESGEMNIDSLASSLKEAKDLITFCKAKLTKVENDVKKSLEN